MGTLSKAAGSYGGYLLRERGRRRAAAQLARAASSTRRACRRAPCWARAARSTSSRRTASSCAAIARAAPLHRRARPAARGEPIESRSRSAAPSAAARERERLRDAGSSSPRSGRRPCPPARRGCGSRSRRAHGSAGARSRSRSRRCCARDRYRPRERRDDDTSRDDLFRDRLRHRRRQDLSSAANCCASCARRGYRARARAGRGRASTSLAPESDGGRLLLAQGKPAALATVGRHHAVALRGAALPPDGRRARASEALSLIPELLEFCRAPSRGGRYADRGDRRHDGAPRDDEQHRARLDERCRAPVLLVVGSYLGTLSHTR